MDLRELIVILLAALGGILFVWLETGRQDGVLTVGGIALGSFAVLGAVWVAIS
jgi:hypothetical protein